MKTIYIRAAPAGTISAFFPIANTTSPPSSAPYARSLCVCVCVCVCACVRQRAHRVKRDDMTGETPLVTMRSLHR